MTPTPQRPTEAARIPALVALVVLLVSVLTAGTAAAAVTPAGSNPLDGSPVVGTTAAPSPEPASAAAPTHVGLVLSSTPSGTGPPAPARPAAPVVRAEPTIVAPNSGDAAVGRPARTAPRTQVPPLSVDAPIVAASSPPALKPALVQLDSGGPLVGSSAGRSSTPAPLGPPGLARPVVGARGGLSSWSRGLPLFAPPVAARVVRVSAAIEGIFLSGTTSARLPGQRPVAAVGRPVGPAGLASVSLGSPGGGGSRTPGGSAWLGSAPLSASGSTGISLVGLNAVLAAVSLLAGVSWRRRSWGWPESGFESLLGASALDRPG